MKLSIPFDISNIDNLSDLVRYTTQVIKQVSDVINGKVSFPDNIDGKFISVVFNVANSTQEISNPLGRVPVGYIPTSLSSGMIIYNGVKSNTASAIYLQATAIGTASIFVF